MANISSKDDVITNDTISQTFQFDNFPIHVSDRNGTIWFFANDVCAVLEINNPSQAIARLDDDEKNTLIINEGIQGNPNVNIISESGLYALVLTSRKPQAKRFKKWVTGEVLPQIRKTGSYSLQAEQQPAIEDKRTRRHLYSPNYKLASELAAQAAQAVFEAVNHTGFNWQRNQRLLLTLNNKGKPIFKPLEPEAFIMSLEKLIELIEKGGGYTSQRQLADLAQVCLRQLSRYWQYNA